MNQEDKDLRSCDIVLLQCRLDNLTVIVFSKIKMYHLI